MRRVGHGTGDVHLNDRMRKGYSGGTDVTGPVSHLVSPKGYDGGEGSCEGPNPKKISKPPPGVPPLGLLFL